MSERAEEVRGECANYTYPSLPTSPALPKNSVSPSTPSERSSTREPATVDGRAPVDGPPSARPVEEIRQLCDAATPGPWVVQRGAPNLVYGDERVGMFVCDVGLGDQAQRDAQFIAAARDLVPQLLAEVEAAHRFEQSAALDSARLAAVEDLVEQARKVSPSSSMTVYVGDLKKALGRRADSVRGIRGAES